MGNTPRREVMSLVDFDGSVHSLAYSWIETDGGRSQSKRKLQSNDCTVRALAIAGRLDYDAAYDLLKAAGRKSGRGFRFGDWATTQSWARKISFPAVKGRRRMNPATFCAQHPHGRFILKTAKHVIACVDGLIHDAFAVSPDRCVYTAWEITPSLLPGKFD